MAIEIIYEGTPPPEEVYEAACARCSSKLRFSRVDGELIDERKGTPTLRVICPVCSYPVYAFGYR